MIGAMLDIGPNLADFGKFALPLIIAGIGAKYARGSKKAAEDTAKQLTNNGGTSALDKLEAGQREIMAELADVKDVQQSQGDSIVRLQSVVWRGDPPPSG